MLQKSFSEGICVEKAGPDSTASFKSTYSESSERSYCTSIFFVPKLVPKRTYLTVNGTSDDIDSIVTKSSAIYNRACSMSNGSVKSYESSVSLDQEEDLAVQKVLNGVDVIDGLKCYQNIELVPGLVMRDFSESINIFPKTKTKAFRSNMSYDDYYLKKNYIVGLEVHKFREVALSETQNEISDFTSSMHITPETVACENPVINGECDDLL